MGLSRTVSEISGDFSRKSQTFPTPVYFADGFPLDIWYRRKNQSKNGGLSEAEKSFKIDLAV